jgi:hypothetical protein
MKKQIIIFGNQRDLLILIKRVKEKMKNNPVFPNPPAALAELEKVLPEFEVALVNARSRDREWVAIKNNKKVIVLALLQELAEYVTVTCKGDRALILSSGFDVTDEQSSPDTPTIETVEVELGAPGEAIVRGKNTTGAVAYVIQYAIEPPGPNTMWHGEGSSTCNHTFTGLNSDKRYWFRVVAIGRKGHKAYSPVVSRSIQ